MLEMIKKISKRSFFKPIISMGTTTKTKNTWAADY